MRAKTCVIGLSLALVLTLLLCASALAAGPFPDVPEGHPYSAAIGELKDGGAIDGYSDGFFRPDALVARQQFAKMIVLGLGLGVSDADICPFPDVQQSLPGSYLDPNDPNYPDHYVAVCAEEGITKGKTATTFAPYDPITLQQLVSMIARAAGVGAAPDWF